MTITVTAIGDSTVQVVTSGTSSTFSDLTSAVRDAIIGVSPTATTGWTLYDSFTSGIIFTQVFRALNIDGVSYKNIILRWNTMSQELNTSTCESWDLVNHVVLANEAWTFMDSSPIPYRLGSCDLIIMVSPRWCVFQSYLAGEQGLWAGVFEMERDDTLDTATAGYPCWGWVSSTLWMLGATGVSSKPLTGADHTLICLPRTRSGNTGVNAAKGYAADYGVASYPNWLSSSVPAFLYHLGNSANKFLTSAWDNSRRLVMPIKPLVDYQNTAFTNHGNICGLKVMAPSGMNMSKLKVVVDSNGNFSAAGASRDHWVLNNHHKMFSADNASWFGNTNWGTTVVTVGAGVRPEYICSTGDFYYVSCGTKTYKVNALSFASTEIATAGSTVTDIKFDGERYVYVGCTTGLWRLDITDDSVSLLTISGGVQTLSINATHILTAPYTATATPTLTRVLRSTFLVDSTNGSLLLTSFSEAVRIVDIQTDFDGNFLCVPTVATSSNFKIIKVTTAASVSYTTAIGQVVSANCCIQILDATNAICWHAVTSSSMYQYQFNPKTMTLISSSSVATLPPLTTQKKITAVKVSGVLVACPVPSGTTTHGTYTTLGSTTSTLPAPILSTAWHNSMSFASMNSFLFSDGCRLISNSDTGLRIFTGVNGDKVYSNTTIGQALIPA